MLVSKDSLPDAIRRTTFEIVRQNMTEKGCYIDSLPGTGLVTFLALVKEKGIRPKRAGGWYLYLLLGDRTGEIEAKAWDQPQEIAALFDRDDIVKVRGTIELYNERPQLIVQRIRRCEDGEFEESDFCPASPQDPDDMFASLAGFVESIGDEKLRALLQSILDDEATGRAFRAAPGGTKLHHCCRGGLLQHTLSLCELIERVVEHYPRLNRDWLIAGALLHDIGKTEELTASRRLGYTTRGQLVGHVALGLEILERHLARVPDFSVETKTLLQHLIVSHHGELENGALREPAFPEALVLHALDELDARLDQAYRVIEQTPSGEEWSAYVPALRRQIYCGRNGDRTSATQPTVPA